jgi:hypothetical protein
VRDFWLGLVWIGGIDGNKESKEAVLRSGNRFDFGQLQFEIFFRYGWKIGSENWVKGWDWIHKFESQERIYGGIFETLVWDGNTIRREELLPRRSIIVWRIIDTEKDRLKEWDKN